MDLDANWSRSRVPFASNLTRLQGLQRDRIVTLFSVGQREKRQSSDVCICLDVEVEKALEYLRLLLHVTIRFAHGMERLP